MIQANLNGLVSERLREAVSITTRRSIGAFFTSSKLRKSVTSRIPADQFKRVYDPTCGAGDLLIAAASRLPVSSDLHETLVEWGEILHGFDREDLFVRAARARLVLLAQQRTKSKMFANPSEYFPNISCADSAQQSCPPDCSLMLLNPPYTSTIAPRGTTFARGKVSSAALFALRSISQLPTGARVRAILPDVLRSGSRYQLWRSELEEMLRVDQVVRMGQFDEHTDIDVFLLSGTRGKGKTFRWVEASAMGTLCDQYEVSVGTVVPHRDLAQGATRRFINARILAGSEVFDAAQAPLLTNSGRAFCPPFVAIRRTSRPGESPRLSATLVLGTEPVFVDNHLLILQAKGGKISRLLLEHLRSEESTRWMDQRIRCRHLTVRAVRELPWNRDEGGMRS